MAETFIFIIVIIIAKVLFEISNIAGGVFLGIVAAIWVIKVFVIPSEEAN